MTDGGSVRLNASPAQSLSAEAVNVKGRLTFDPAARVAVPKVSTTGAI